MDPIDSDQEFEKLCKSKFENYLNEFEVSRQKARSISALIEHLHHQMICDFPTSGFGNVYISDILYTFYKSYNLGASIEEICINIQQIRKEHLLKIAEKPDNYERSSMDFNITVQDKTSIINFLANHFAKKEFIGFLNKQKLELENSNAFIDKNFVAQPLKNEAPNNGKPTNAQKLLVFYYLQRVSLFPQSDDILPLSEFITFLTGQNQKNTYDQLREIDDYKRTKKNLIVVRQQFVRLGLHEVVVLIDDDLKGCWK